MEEEHFHLSHKQTSIPLYDMTWKNVRHGLWLPQKNARANYRDADQPQPRTIIMTVTIHPDLQCGVNIQVRAIREHFAKDRLTT